MPEVDSRVGRVVCGDWYDTVRTLPPALVDLVLTDPPYECSTRPTDRQPDWKLFMAEMARVCRDTSEMWIFCRQPWATDVMVQARAHGWTFVQEVIWEKQNGGGCTFNTFRKVHENIFHFKRPNAPENDVSTILVPGEARPNATIRKRGGTSQFIGVKNSGYEYGDTRIARSVQRIRNVHMTPEALSHPHQKPISLGLMLVGYSSSPGGIVLDPFCGTGTFAEAAATLGRRYIAIDVDPVEADKARKRLEGAGDSLMDVDKEG